MQLLFAGPGTVEFAVLVELWGYGYLLHSPSQTLSHSLKVSPACTSLLGMTVCIVPPSSFIQHFG